MKKIILIALFGIGLAFNGLAQGITTLKATTGAYSSSSTKTLDTCTNMVDTVYFVYNATDLKNGSLELISKRISGTCVVTAYLECSNNGTFWWSKSAADTINLKPAASATKAGGLVITQNNVKYYRYRIIGHAAGVIQLSGNGCLRRD